MYGCAPHSVPFLAMESTYSFYRDTSEAGCPNDMATGYFRFDKFMMKLGCNVVLSHLSAYHLTSMGLSVKQTHF